MICFFFLLSRNFEHPLVNGCYAQIVINGNSYSGEARGLGMQIFLQGFRVLI